MLKLMDCFFYYIYRALSFLRRPDYLARASAMVYAAIWLCWLFTACISLVGMMIDNPISQFVVNSSPLVFTLIWGGVGGLISALRYYRHYRSVEEVAQMYRSLTRRQRVWMAILFVVVLIGVPVAFFCSYRLYKFGHI